RPQLVFTIGGLGPTGDDLTLRGVALATGRPLELHAEAERMVREKYEEFFRSGHVPTPEMNDARRKMACLPRDAEPLSNPVGGAPGVWLEVDGCAIVSLPGVPEELRAIVSESLPTRLTSLFGPAHYEERSLVLPELQDESVIADVLRRAAAEPGVYVKSRARRFGEGRALRITVSARAAEAEEVQARLSATLRRLAQGITAAGFAVVVEDEAQDREGSEAAGS
ncbi:MAG TPA: molybdopterin-binding protein, partial [Thermoleophilia bacterium]|nr:molybdopterin-binding protein [Thermoleophilia bacterium]